MIIVDTSGVLAALDSNEPSHALARAALTGDTTRLLSPMVLTEIDYMIGQRAGAAAQRAFLADVADGAYQLEPFGREDVAEARVLLARYADLRIGLADASMVVLANRHRVLDVLTLDERHFRVLRGPGDRTFRLLPADA